MKRHLFNSTSAVLIGCTAFWCGMATPTWARAVQMELGLVVTGNVTQADLSARAEQLIAEQVRSTFAAQSDVTEIRVYVLANHAGQSVPIIFTQVSRSQWQNQPEIRQYSRYLDAGVMLLGLGSGAQRTITHQSSVSVRYRDDIAFRDD
jgi:hypothetical protein